MRLQLWPGRLPATLPATRSTDLEDLIDDERPEIGPYTHCGSFPRCDRATPPHEIHDRIVSAGDAVRPARQLQRPLDVCNADFALSNLNLAHNLVAIRLAHGQHHRVRRGHGGAVLPRLVTNIVGTELSARGIEAASFH